MNKILKLIFYQIELLDSIQHVSEKMLTSITDCDVDLFCQYTDDREEIIKLINLIGKKIYENKETDFLEFGEPVNCLQLDLQRIINNIIIINDKIDQQAQRLQNTLKLELAQTFLNRTKLSRFHSQNSCRP